MCTGSSIEINTMTCTTLTSSQVELRSGLQSLAVWARWNIEILGFRELVLPTAPKCSTMPQKRPCKTRSVGSFFSRHGLSLSLLILPKLQIRLQNATWAKTLLLALILVAETKYRIASLFGNCAVFSIHRLSVSTLRRWRRKKLQCGNLWISSVSAWTRGFM